MSTRIFFGLYGVEGNDFELVEGSEFALRALYDEQQVLYPYAVLFP
jgi:hypothetical protein